MKVLTIGGATQDIFIHYDKHEVKLVPDEMEHRTNLLLQEGAKIEVADLSYATGGGATNAAVSFKRLDFNTSICCTVGNDQQAGFIEQQLMKDNIKTTFIHKAKLSPTGVSFILPTPSSDRIIFAYRGANAHMQKDMIPFDHFKEFDCLYITSLSGKASSLLLPITKKAKEHNLFIANNPGKSQLSAGADVLQQSLPYLDVLILNACEAQELMYSIMHTNPERNDENYTQKTHDSCELLKPISFKNITFNLFQFMQIIQKRGPKIIAVTNGSEGVYVAKDNVLYFHPSIKTAIANTTLGAGDAFGSCFAAMIAKGTNVAESLVKGIINASHVIAHTNAKDGLLTQDALEKMYKKINTKDIKTFDLIKG